jgi:hypothetical protein
MAIYDDIENYGTGGGLCRPIFADFLFEADAATGIDVLRTLGDQFAELGRRWTELADAAHQMTSRPSQRRSTS